MKRKKLVIELPVLSHEAAAAVHEIFYKVMGIIDDHYYHQIYQYYRNQSIPKSIDNHPDELEISEPPF